MGKDRKNYKKETAESEKARSLLDDMHTKYDDDKLLEEILMETLNTPSGKKSHISDTDLSDILGTGPVSSVSADEKKPKRPLEFNIPELPKKEQKPAEQKPTEQKPAEQKSAEQKPTEQKPTEQKPVEQKPAEKKSRMSLEFSMPDDASEAGKAEKSAEKKQKNGLELTLPVMPGEDRKVKKQSKHLELNLSEIETEKVPEKPEPKKIEEPKPEPKKAPEKPAKQLKVERPAEKQPEMEKPVEKKPEPEKPVEKKPEPEKPAEKQPEPEKPAEKQPEPEKPVKKKPEPEKPAEQPKAEEPEKPAAIGKGGLDAKIVDITVRNHEVSIDSQKPVEQKPVEQKPVEQKPAEQKPVEQKRAEHKPTEQNSVEKKIAPTNLAEFVEFSEEDRRVNAEISAAVSAAIAEKAEKNKAAKASDEPAKKKKAKKKAPEIKPVKPILNIANIVYTAVAFAAVTAAFLALPRDNISETEQRKLAEFPTFSADDFLNGKYTNGITDYFNDNVPYRDDLKKVAAQIRSLYGISYNNAEIIGPVAVVTTEADIEPDIDEPEQTTTTAAPVTEKTTGRTTAPVTTTAETTTTPETTTQPVETTKNVNEIAAGVVTNGQVVTKLSDGHWWGISLFGGGNGKTYAKALNRFKKELGDDVNVWSMPAPTSGEFYLPDSYAQYNASHAKSVEQINSQLKGVTPVDCISALWQHTNENIYLRTDHHWQPLGAYYAAKAFVEAAGLPFADISTMERVEKEGYMGTMYGFTESANLLADPETFVYYKPTNKYYAYYYDTAYNYTGQFSFFIPMPVNGSYSTFMGADNKIVRIKTDAGTGRKLVVFKDSYGNAEIPFYFNSFDEVYVCDMRYFDLNGVEFIKFTGATDVLFTCCTFSAVGTNANGLETILNNPVTTITEGAGR